MNQLATLQPLMATDGAALRLKSPGSAGPDGADVRRRPVYLALLTWAFTLFNTLRAVSYLPTMWAIQASGDSSQHSLWTWCTWLGANVTMAAWLYEQDGQRLGRAVIVNIGNATMCAVTVALIVAHRGWVG
jgi:hypothetical protein